MALEVYFGTRQEGRKKKSGSGDILAYFSLDALLDEWIELPF